MLLNFINKTKIYMFTIFIAEMTSITGKTIVLGNKEGRAVFLKKYCIKENQNLKNSYSENMFNFSVEKTQKSDL